jgi:hypothetical protein
VNRPSVCPVSARLRLPWQVCATWRRRIITSRGPVGSWPPKPAARTRRHVRENPAASPDSSVSPAPSRERDRASQSPAPMELCRQGMNLRGHSPEVNKSVVSRWRERTSGCRWAWYGYWQRAAKAPEWLGCAPLSPHPSRRQRSGLAAVVLCDCLESGGLACIAHCADRTVSSREPPLPTRRMRSAAAAPHVRMTQD